MSTVFPNDIDSDLELPRVDNNVTEIGGDAINSLRDAVFAIENTIGANPQGNAADLVTRINVSLDANGNIKSSALATRGLVTLPIYNSQIGDTAGIVETKLALDYPTATLNGRITSNATDIDTLRNDLITYVQQVTRHFVATENRHDGYEVDLTAEVRGVSTVEAAINLINNAFVAHTVSETDVHAASSISVNNEFTNISATNVQSALNEIDSLEGVGIERHQDRLHLSAIALNDRGEQGSHGNLKETTFASTIYQTDTSKATNILQVMRPNVARVTGSNIDFQSLSVGTNQQLRIQAGGVGRGTLDVNLASVLPTDDINRIVYIINYTAHAGSEHYPISAYNTNGKLTIAHNIPGKQFTIQILDTIQFSAATALGFGDVLSTTFDWPEENNIGYIGGKTVRGLKQLISEHYVHSAPLNTISLGLGDLSSYGLTTGNEGRVLCNITNHSSDSSYNGTYYILSYPTGETFVVSEDIAAGTFDIEIVSDSVNFQNSTNGELFDIFIEYDSDGYGTIDKSKRVAYGPISGVSLRSITESFPTSGMEWQVVDSSTIRILENGTEGVSVDIPTSFVGQMQVFAPDNINSALFEVTGPPSSYRKNLTVYSFDDSDDKIHIGSVHYSGNYGINTLKFVTDKRLLGGTVENRSEDKLNPVLIEDYTKELRNNGVIRGLDVMSSGTSSFRIRGGRVLVDGRIVDVETQDITVNDFTASTQLLLIDRNGNFTIKNEYDSGFTFSELTAGDAYGDDRGVAIICSFETDGTSIDGYFADRRLIVSNIDKKLVDTSASLEQKITEIRNTVQGSSWGFTIAEASADGYLAGIETGANNGFDYIPGQYETPTSAYGFAGGRGTITTRRFQFSHPDTIVTSVFRAVGLTHINVFLEATYTGVDGGPFGVSGEVYIEVGVAVETGMSSLTVSEDYARVKTLYSGVLPTDSLTERYVVSIPVTRLNLPENTMFDVVPRIKIINSDLVDGGISVDNEPTIRFDNVRIVTSSYSVAGSIDEVDETNTSIGVTVGEIL